MDEKGNIIDENGDIRTQFTTKEVVELKFSIGENHYPIPEPRTCKYCGNTLYYLGIVLWGSLIAWSPMPQRCTCDRAIAYWKRRDDEESTRQKEQELEEQRKKRLDHIEKLFGQSGIKKRFANRTFDNFLRDTPERKQCYEAAKKYADNFDIAYKNGDGLYILGSNGTGKTHLAAAIALQLLSNEVPVIFKTSVDLFADIKKAFDSEETNEYEITKAYKTVDLLIIDDLGKERCTEWSMTTLYDIINDRYEDMKPTVITTNYNVNEIAEALTPHGGDRTKIDAIISRLKETSTVILMRWEDWRSRSDK